MKGRTKKIELKEKMKVGKKKSKSVGTWKRCGLSFCQSRRKEIKSRNHFVTWLAKMTKKDYFKNCRNISKFQLCLEI